MNKGEQQYLDLLSDLVENSSYKDDRTGTGTYSFFGRQMRFDLQKEGFPLLTTKKVFLKGIIHELLWFLSGSSNIKYLVDNNVNIWNDWPYRYYKNQMEKKNKEYFSTKDFIEKIKTDNIFAQKWGRLGPVYGVQWRAWQTSKGNKIDQIKNLIENINLVKKDKTHSSSRRLIVSAWNVSDIEEMTKSGLPPCHTLFQFYVLDGKISCQLYQRSADFFLGVPFNIASYSLLLMMVAKVTNLIPHEFVHTFGDVHLYKNHLEQAKEQLERKPKTFPKMKIKRNVKSIFEFKFDDFELVDYTPYPPIKAPIAV